MLTYFRSGLGRLADEEWQTFLPELYISRLRRFLGNEATRLQEGEYEVRTFLAALYLEEWYPTFRQYGVRSLPELARMSQKELKHVTQDDGVTNAIWANFHPEPQSARRRKKKPKRDPNAPVPPPTAYLRFYREIKPEYNDGLLTHQQINRDIGKRWMELPAEEKNARLKRAFAEIVEHDKKKEAYKGTEGDKAHHEYLAELRAHEQERERASQIAFPEKLDNEKTAGSVLQPSRSLPASSNFSYEETYTDSSFAGPPLQQLHSIHPSRPGYQAQAPPHPEIPQDPRSHYPYPSLTYQEEESQEQHQQQQYTQEDSQHQTYDPRLYQAYDLPTQHPQYSQLPPQQSNPEIVESHPQFPRRSPSPQLRRHSPTESRRPSLPLPGFRTLIPPEDNGHPTIPNPSALSPELAQQRIHAPVPGHTLLEAHERNRAMEEARRREEERRREVWDQEIRDMEAAGKERSPSGQYHHPPPSQEAGPSSYRHRYHSYSPHNMFDRVQGQPDHNEQYEDWYAIGAPIEENSLEEEGEGDDDDDNDLVEVEGGEMAEEEEDLYA